MGCCLIPALWVSKATKPEVDKHAMAEWIPGPYKIPMLYGSIPGIRFQDFFCL
jgi:hypothetical protein